jgi:hypothetical protein
MERLKGYGREGKGGESGEGRREKVRVDTGKHRLLYQASEAGQVDATTSLRILTSLALWALALRACPDSHVKKYPIIHRGDRTDRHRGMR